MYKKQIIIYNNWAQGGIKQKFFSKIKYIQILKFANFHTDVVSNNTQSHPPFLSNDTNNEVVDFEEEKNIGGFSDKTDSFIPDELFQLKIDLFKEHLRWYVWGRFKFRAPKWRKLIKRNFDSLHVRGLVRKTLFSRNNIFAKKWHKGWMFFFRKIWKQKFSFYKLYTKGYFAFILKKFRNDTNFISKGKLIANPSETDNISRHRFLNISIFKKEKLILEKQRFLISLHRTKKRLIFFRPTYKNMRESDGTKAKLKVRVMRNSLSIHLSKRRGVMFYQPSKKIKKYELVLNSKWLAKKFRRESSMRNKNLVVFERKYKFNRRRERKKFKYLKSFGSQLTKVSRIALLHAREKKNFIYKLFKRVRIHQFLINFLHYFSKYFNHNFYKSDDSDFLKIENIKIMSKFWNFFLQNNLDEDNEHEKSNEEKRLSFRKKTQWYRFYETAYFNPRMWNEFRNRKRLRRLKRRMKDTKFSPYLRSLEWKQMRFDKLEEWYQKDSSFFIKEFFFSSLFEDNLQILSLEKYNVLSVFFKIFNLLKKISLKAGFISKINVKMENMVDFVKSILTLSAGEDEETELKIKNDFSLLSLIKKSNMYLKDFPKTKQLELKFLNKFIYLLTNKSIWPNFFKWKFGDLILWEYHLIRQIIRFFDDDIKNSIIHFFRKKLEIFKHLRHRNNYRAWKYFINLKIKNNFKIIQSDLLLKNIQKMWLNQDIANKDKYIYFNEIRPGLKKLYSCLYSWTFKHENNILFKPNKDNLKHFFKFTKNVPNDKIKSKMLFNTFKFFSQDDNSLNNFKDNFYEMDLVLEAFYGVGFKLIEPHFLKKSKEKSWYEMPYYLHRIYFSGLSSKVKNKFVGQSFSKTLREKKSWEKMKQRHKRDRKIRKEVGSKPKTKKLTLEYRLWHFLKTFTTRGLLNYNGKKQKFTLNLDNFLLNTNLHLFTSKRFFLRWKQVKFNLNRRFLTHVKKFGKIKNPVYVFSFFKQYKWSLIERLRKFRKFKLDKIYTYQRKQGKRVSQYRNYSAIKKFKLGLWIRPRKTKDLWSLKKKSKIFFFKMLFKHFSYNVWRRVSNPQIFGKKLDKQNSYDLFLKNNISLLVYNLGWMPTLSLSIESIKRGWFQKNFEDTKLTSFISHLGDTINLKPRFWTYSRYFWIRRLFSSNYFNIKIKKNNYIFSTKPNFLFIIRMKDENIELLDNNWISQTSLKMFKNYL